MTDGVIYVATGAGYRDLAEASARSLARTNPGLAMDLFTDAPGEMAATGLFARVHAVPRVHARAKLDCLPLSRFDRTLYLDCDTLVLRGLGDLFDIADRFELALAHDMRRASALIRAGQEVATPYAFPQMNSGVMLYRAGARMAAFFAEWARRFAAAPELDRDQPVLKDMLWQSDIRLYILPPEFNLRRVTMLDAWEPQDALPTIVHSHRLMDHMRRPGAPRIETLEDLVAAERAALEDEWRAAAVGGPAGFQRPGI